MAGAYGFATKLGIDSADPVTKRFDFHRADLAKRAEHTNTNGLRGILDDSIERNIDSIYRINGPLVFLPNAVELALFLPWITGHTGSGSPTVTYTPNDTTLTRFVTIDRVSKVHTYAGVGVDRARFYASQGESLTLTLDCLGQTETEAASGSFPAIDIDLTTKPWKLHHLALTVAGITRNAREFELTVNNNLDRERFFNSQSLVTVQAKRREWTLRIPMPYGDANAVYTSSMVAGGVAVVATFTTGGQVFTISAVKVGAPQLTPAIEGHEEIMLDFSGTAMMSSTTRPVVFTLNPTP